MLTLQVATVFLVAVTMSLALAHALEFPGKLRLEEHTYLAVQTIYYPGFTIAGIAEPLAIAATFTLIFMTPRDHAPFGWILAALLALVTMHAVFWFMTQPTNRFWLKNERLSAPGARFFSVQPQNESVSREGASQDWRRLRDRWEYSHIARAVLSGIALIAIVTAIAM